ncbi:transglycosylase SLT domain-containing protein [Amycolatopsis sp. NPDC004378]
MQKVNQVEKVDLAKITAAARQFHEAGKNAGDHNASLKSSTEALKSGVWAGPAADQFFAYVQQVGDAGAKVQTHLEDVGKDLDDLASTLEQIKKNVGDKQLAAEKAVNDRNQQAQAAMDAAKNAAAEHEKDPNKPAPSPTEAEILAKAKTDIHDITAGFDGDVTGLQTQADTAIKASQTLMSQQIEGGYDQVPLPSSSASAPKSTGGIHSSGASHHGGGGGGGGGLGPSGGPPSSPPPGNVQQWIQEAIKELQAAGVPVTDADIKNIWAIIQHESGGNPNAINNWDSNAAAGHPSKGLMQCIDSTFNAHKLPGHDNIYNPVDNIIAGVRYSIDRYGGLANVPGIKAMAHGGAYQGY